MTIRGTLTAEVLIQLHVREGLSLSQIGNRFGCSRQRVHQIKQEHEKAHGKINRRTILDVFTLHHYLEKGWSDGAIASHFDLKTSQVSRMIRVNQKRYKEGKVPILLVRKKAEDVLPKTLLYHYYVEQLKTDKEIATLVHLSPSTVNNLRKKHGIPTNNQKSLRRLPQRLPKEKLVSLLKYQTTSEIAERHGCSVASLIGLKHDYGLMA